MNWRPTFAILVATATVTLAGTPPSTGNGEPAMRVLRLASHRVEAVALEDYVSAVLPAEIGNAPAAALEAQAIAARSYAIGKTNRHVEEGADVCDGTHCQVYRGRGSSTPASRRATEATKGVVLTLSGRVIAAPFHACCGGRTSRPAEVWDDEETPDIAPVDDDACLGGPGSVWEFRLPRAEVQVLGGAVGLSRARYLEVFGRGRDGRVASVRFVAPKGIARVVRGFEFRRVANELWGWSSVRSTAFELTEERHQYVLSGRGTGHGAGLCQVGAIARARRGETAEHILRHYYPGVSFIRLGKSPEGA